MKQLEMDLQQSQQVERDSRVKSISMPQANSVTELQQQVGHVDDGFIKRNQAQRIIDNNQNLSYQALKQYLIKKGISSKIIDELLHVSDTHELYNALHIIGKRYPSIKGKTPYHVQQKMIQYLARKGFGFDIAKEAMEKYMSSLY